MYSKESVDILRGTVSGVFIVGYQKKKAHLLNIYSYGEEMEGHTGFP